MEVGGFDSFNKQNKEEHHKKWIFMKEYSIFPKKFKVEYDHRIIFQEVKYDHEESGSKEKCR